MDININTPRERLASFNINNSRASSVYLDISSILYYERMEIQSNKLSWNKQVEINTCMSFSLLYATPKISEDIPTYETTDYNSKKGV